MQDITLQAPAIIGGKRYPAGKTVTATPEAVETGIRRAARQDIRGKISDEVGDTESLLGTTADASAIAILGVAALAVAAKGAGNYSDFKKALLDMMNALASGNDMASISQAFLDRVQSGEVILPAMAKGVGDVISDIETRSTAVARALVAAQAEE